MPLAKNEKQVGDVTEELTVEDMKEAREESHSARNTAMESIEAARNQMLAEDGVEVNVETPEDKEEPENKEADEAGDTDQDKDDSQATDETPDKTPDESTKKPDSEQLVPINISGKLEQVPVSKLVETYQIEGAARDKLEIASRTLKSVQEMEERLAAQQPPAKDKEQEEPEADPEKKTGARELVDKIQYGTADEATAALEDFLQRNPVEDATPQDVEGQVNAALQRHDMAKEFETAKERFGTEYKDIQGDTILNSMALGWANNLWLASVTDFQENGTPLPSYWDIFNTVGANLRKWRTDITSDPEDTPSGQDEKLEVDLSSERDDKKKAASQSPTSRTVTKPSVTQAAPQTEEQSRKSGIAGIIKGRGQIV